MKRGLPTPKDEEGVSEKSKFKVLNALNHAPLSFIENRGQTDSRVKYYTKGNKCTFYFTPNEIKFGFIKPKAKESSDQNSIHKKEELMRVTVAQEFIDANREVEIEAHNPSQTTANYFKGNDPAKWRTQIPVCAKIVYKELWKGIDLALFGEKGKLKYEFIVQPGASVKEIQFVYKDLYETCIDENGNLIITTPFGDLTDEKPVGYQMINGKKEIVESEYFAKDPPAGSACGSLTEKKESRTIYGYRTGKYDKNYPLIIDPEILYSSYLGGGDDDVGYGIAVDQNGNAYVTGYTYSTNFPTVNAFQPSFRGGNFDAFVSKINSTPSIVYSSFLGGSGDDWGWEIAVDQNGNVYVTGETNSTDFPTVHAFQPSFGGSGDAFVTKIDSTPSIAYSSYLGGNGYDRGLGIAVDQSGNAFVTGGTWSTNFPTVHAFQPSYGGSGDAFVTKIDSTPSIVYSNYLGGSSSDWGSGIAVDQNGDAYISGYTASTNFPTVHAFQPSLAGTTDAFITKIDSTPSIAYSSYLGGSGDESGLGIAVDPSSNAYVTGVTFSSDFPTVHAFQPSLAETTDAFITKIDSTPSIVYSSYLGGSERDFGYEIAVDQSGNAYVTGATYSTDFPTVHAFQPTFAGNIDAFVTKIDLTPSIAYSSYLGGNEFDAGYGIAVDQSGNAYVTGGTVSTDFPTVHAFQPNPAGHGDVFVTKIGRTFSIQVKSARLSIMRIC